MNQPNGIGGWLALYVVGLIIIIPIFSMINLVQSLEYMGLFKEAFPKSYPLFVIDLLMGFCIIGFSITVGLFIVTEKYYAIVYAKLFIITFTIFILLEPVLLTAGPDISKVYSNLIWDEAETSFVRQITYFIVWFSYLSVSKRVKNTFPFTRLSALFGGQMKYYQPDNQRDYQPKIYPAEQLSSQSSNTDVNHTNKDELPNYFASKNKSDLSKVNQIEFGLDQAQKVFGNEDDKKYAEILGLSGKSISKADIIRNYEELMKKYEPDVAVDMGEEFIEFAKRQRREINKAYLYFKKRYNL